jgi:hypothetical protein
MASADVSERQSGFAHMESKLGIKSYKHHNFMNIKYFIRQRRMCQSAANTVEQRPDLFCSS